MADETKPSFEDALREVETILRELEDGNTTLEESLARYERGIGLIKSCYTQLQLAETKIRQLAGIGPNGEPVLQPFEHKATVEKATAKKRAKPMDEN